MSKPRFVGLSGVDAEKGFVLSNTINFSVFSIRSKTYLMELYEVTKDLYMLMIFRWLSRSGQKKGFDRVLKILFIVLEQRNQIHYLIFCKGTDREQLEGKAKDLEEADTVFFALRV